MAKTPVLITTGFAYVVRDGIASGELCLRIGAKYHPADNEEVIQVNSREELNAVSLTPPSPSKEQKIALLKNQLREIDFSSIRAIRTNDTVRMAQWESQASDLRRQIQDLG